MWSTAGHQRRGAARSTVRLRIDERRTPKAHQVLLAFRSSPHSSVIRASLGTVHSLGGRSRIMTSARAVQGNAKSYTTVLSGAGAHPSCSVAALMWARSIEKRKVLMHDTAQTRLIDYVKARPSVQHLVQAFFPNGMDPTVHIRAFAFSSSPSMR